MLREASWRVAILAIGAGIALSCLLIPLSARAASIPPGLAPAQAAHALEKAIRRGRPVPYNGNVVVKALAENHKREIFIKSTVAPLDYDPDPAVPNDDEYFRLPLSDKKTPPVRPIPAEDIIAVKPLPVVPDLPHVKVVSHEGVVSADFGPTLDTDARLSNGSHMTLIVGLTKWFTEHVETDGTKKGIVQSSRSPSARFNNAEGRRRGHPRSSRPS